MNTAAKTKNTIVIAEDHALMRAGIRSLLGQMPDLDVVGEADNGRDAIRLACTLRPTLLLTDISLPGISGLDAISEIKRRHEDIKILVISMHKTDEYVLGALRLGASGYLVKDSTQYELPLAVRALLDGKIYLSSEISDRVIKHIASNTENTSAAWDRLTTREREVIKLAAEGNTNRQTGIFLSLSAKTIEKHRANAMQKLGLRNISMLTAYAIGRGIVSRKR
jgi:DNA-binding NarL/FixJ family response regulator